MRLLQQRIPVNMRARSFAAPPCRIVCRVELCSGKSDLCQASEVGTVRDASEDDRVNQPHILREVFCEHVEAVSVVLP